MKDIQNQKQSSIFIVLFVIFCPYITPCWAWEPCDEIDWGTWECGLNSQNCPAEEADGDVTYQKLFDKDAFDEVQLVNTCDSVSFNPCGGCGEATTSVSLPPFLGSSPTLDWGKQGANVVVVDCGTIFPAEGTIDEGETSACYGIEREVTCTRTPPAEPFDITFKTRGSASDTHYYMAVFDDEVFRVNGWGGSPKLVGTSITVTLVDSDCETLQKALDAKVEIYHQKVQRSWACNDCYGGESLTDCDQLNKSELTQSSKIATVGVKIDGDVFDCRCPGPGSPKVCPIG